MSRIINNQNQNMNKTLDKHNTLVVTGGAGFIGTNFCYYWNKQHPDDRIIILDALTYAGNRSSLAELEKQSTVRFVHGSINDATLVDDILSEATMVIHFAAESHVDRSITNPNLFLQTNVMGTHTLLQAALKHSVARFHHISTDEVFGSLPLDSREGFSETTAYSPRSPYAASKAASDHLVRAYAETYGLPVTITNCSNNYGEYQFPEKLIPLAITNLLEGGTVPIYGPGNQIRDWLYVQDHCRAIELVLLNGEVGQTYLVGGLTEDITNLELIKLVLKIMNRSESSIQFVADRPGHDQKYRVNWNTIQSQLGWQPSVDLEQGLQRTIDWYTNNQAWWKPLKEANAAYFSAQYNTAESS
jgi:dTDP-glucose 4,6-dehydratase